MYEYKKLNKDNIIFNCFEWCFSAEYVGLEYEYKFDGLEWKNSFIIDMKNGVSEYKFSGKDGKIPGKTNLETLSHPLRSILKNQAKLQILFLESQESLSHTIEIEPLVRK